MSTAIVDQPADPAVADDVWSVAQLEKNGQPLLARYRSRCPEGVDSAKFPFLLSATWKYQANDLGLPAADEVELMDKFEDALATAFEGSQTAHLLVVLTGGGDRDWLWYTTGEEAAMQQVNRALKGQRRYPVEFSVQKDRGWRAYAQFAALEGARPNAAGLLGMIRWALAGVSRLFG